MADSKKVVRRQHNVGTPAVQEDRIDSTEPEQEASGVSLFDALKRQISQSVTVDDYVLDVPMRPGVALVFRPEVDWDTYQLWVKRATDKRNDTVDYMKLANTVISNLNTGIKLNNQMVPNSDGDMLRITSREIHEWLGVPIGSTQQAIKKMYGLDGHAIQALKLIVEKSGYSIEGDVLEADDSPLAD